MRHLLAAILCTLAYLTTGCGSGLQEFTSHEGKFHISFPGVPTPGKEASANGVRKVDKVSLDQRGGTLTVAWEDLPASKLSPQERLDLACSGAIGSLKGKVLSRKPISGGSYPGLELKMEWPGGEGVVLDRMYLAGDRLYHVMASGQAWWVAQSSTSSVLDSFQIDSE